MDCTPQGKALYKNWNISNREKCFPPLQEQASCAQVLIMKNDAIMADWEGSIEGLEKQAKTQRQQCQEESWMKQCKIHLQSEEVQCKKPKLAIFESVKEASGHLDAVMELVSNTNN